MVERVGRSGALALLTAAALGVGAWSASTVHPQPRGDAAGAAPSRPSAPARAAQTLRLPGRPDVRIVRDTWGVPHVYAGDTFGVFYGYGYSVARDRLFQLEMARRSATGTVAEVLGAPYADFDVSIRTNFTPSSIRRQIAALARRDRAILRGYAAGFSARVDEVLAQPERLLPAQFREFGFSPRRWTAFDVAMVFVGSMANRFSDATAELDNLRVLQALRERHGAATADALFDQLHPINDPTAPTTVPGARRARARAATASAQRGLADAPEALSLARRRQALATDDARAGVPPEFSNVWLVGRRRARGARAILMNGPQFSWFVPSYVYAIGLHGGGFDVVGNTPFAYPAILFGHNRDIAWGATAGVGNSVDVYEEHLHPTDPNRYLFRGQWLTMGRRTETIAVKGEPDRRIEVLRTRHGLVLSTDPARRIAYAKRRAWDGLEIRSLIAWTRSTQASNHREWSRQAARHALTINWYYADRHGNIAYAHTGRYPIRARGHDPRLPALGTGSMEWRGFHPFRWNPQVVNPRTGYLANWNNKPARSYDNNDTVAWGYADRVSVIDRLIARQRRLGPRRMVAINRQVAHTDVAAPFLLPHVRTATAGLAAGDPARLAGDVLARWNGLDVDRDGDGRYDDPATALMRTWLPLLQRAVLGDDIPAAVAGAYLRTGYPDPARTEGLGSVNITNGTKAVVNALRGAAAGVRQTYDVFNGADRLEVVRQTLREAVAQLGARFGADPVAWREPIAPLIFSAKNFWGIPQASPGEQIREGALPNRGTENDLVVFPARGRVRGYEVVAPGQSGFVDAAGRRARHYSDQLGLYRDFRLKRTWLFPDDVRAHRASRG
jgi:penicillin amidase